jgi:hypothetical protein
MQSNAKNDDKILHWCEACDREELLTPDAGYESGWDFPPKMGTFGVISPRTCPNCTIDKTAWFAIISGRDLNKKQMKAAKKMMNENARAREY